MKRSRGFLRNTMRQLGIAVRPLAGSFCWMFREYLSRMLLLDLVMGFVADCRIDGAYLEFGCADGGSLSDAFHASRRHRGLKNMQFLVFDSFEGLPEPCGLDAHESLRYRKGDFACSVETYRKNIRKRGVNVERVTLIPGWYSDTLTEELGRTLAITKAAVVWIDCDLYESTIPVLDFITRYIQDGTVVIFDDWFSYKGRLDRGEALAFTEWLGAHPSIIATEYHTVGRTIKAFIMQVRSAQPEAVL
jgi:O-methyltransferase